MANPSLLELLLEDAEFSFVTSYIHEFVFHFSIQPVVFTWQLYEITAGNKFAAGGAVYMTQSQLLAVVHWLVLSVSSGQCHSNNVQPL